MTRAPAPTNPRIRRLASTVYDAQAGGRSVLDGPWWLSLIGVVVVTVLVFAVGPGKWLVAPFAVAFFLMPACVRWIHALGRSVGAFREGFRS